MDIKSIRPYLVNTLLPLLGTMPDDAWNVQKRDDLRVAFRWAVWTQLRRKEFLWKEISAATTGGLHQTPLVLCRNVPPHATCERLFFDFLDIGQRPELSCLEAFFWSKGFHSVSRPDIGPGFRVKTSLRGRLEYCVVTKVEHLGPHEVMHLEDTRGERFLCPDWAVNS